MPRAVEKHGTSHYGGLAPDKEYVPLAQTGHEGYKIDPSTGAPGEKEVDLKMIPNYRECKPPPAYGIDEDALSSSCLPIARF